MPATFKMSSTTGNSCEDLLARYGKSFHLAGKFLPLEKRQAATQLYSFCRGLDDLADETGDADQIEAVAMAIERNEQSNALARLYLSLGHPDPVPAITLARALRDDTGSRSLPDEQALLRYCHGVAGTVGIMMARVLGASNPAAVWHATDLGIALQLTNIARDVFEDADHHRRYIPASWLDVSPGLIRSVREEAHRASLQCLALAEKYYASGLDGLVYLPGECRQAILIAARVYGEIGIELRRKGPHRMVDRVLVPRWRKVAIVAKCYFDRSSWSKPTKPHDPSLHHYLAGLVGTHTEEASPG